MAITIQHKRGDTFDHLLLLPDSFADGFFVGWAVASQVRTTRGKLVADLAVSWADPAADTRVLQLLGADTTTWPVGTLEFDVQFTRSDGVVRSTETVLLEVLRDQTQEAA